MINYRFFNSQDTGSVWRVELCGRLLFLLAVEALVKQRANPIAGMARSDTSCDLASLA